MISATSLPHQTTTDITFMSNATVTNNFATNLQTVVMANSYYPALGTKKKTIILQHNASEI